MEIGAIRVLAQPSSRFKATPALKKTLKVFEVVNFYRSSAPVRGGLGCYEATFQRFWGSWVLEAGCYEAALQNIFDLAWLEPASNFIPPKKRTAQLALRARQIPAAAKNWVTTPSVCGLDQIHLGTHQVQSSLLSQGTEKRAICALLRSRPAASAKYTWVPIGSG